MDDFPDFSKSDWPKGEWKDFPQPQMPEIDWSNIPTPPPSFTQSEWTGAAYVSLPFIIMVAIFWIIFEYQRRRMLSLLDKGYYFVEELVTLRRRRLIPVSPDNVDKNDAVHPRIINPSLIERDNCYCF